MTSCPDAPPRRQNTLLVARRRMLTETTVALDLVDPAGRQLPAWEPGAHIDVQVPIDGRAQPRQYSLCGALSDSFTWRIAVQRDPRSRGGSIYLVDEAAIGARLCVRGPRNHFQLVTAAAYLFIAGGIGITPILPMISAAEAACAQWQLHYGGRTRQTMAFAQELIECYPDRVTLIPQDERGLIDVRRLIGTSPTAELYCCGPSALLDVAELTCIDNGRTLHLERFSPRHLDARSQEARPLRVHLARMGLTLEVPADRSILEVAEEAGADVFGSCLEGVCGTCETTVLDGSPDHRDSVLDGTAGDTMMICISRAHTDHLVLDL